MLLIGDMPELLPQLRPATGLAGAVMLSCRGDVSSGFAQQGRADLQIKKAIRLQDAPGGLHEVRVGETLRPGNHLCDQLHSVVGDEQWAVVRAVSLEER
jgi:hypothetical protein